MGKIIGIDLGTTFSAVAQLDDTGRAVIVHNQEGENITASAVEFVSDELIYVGSEAKKSLGTDSKNVLEKFKIEMGRDKQYETDYGNFSPRELSTLVLSKLKKDTEEKIGEIDSAVVTIPANFSNNAREETIKAAEDAGLNVDYIINEPTAAALFYSKESGEDLSEPICVFDLGGGTFDVSIIQVEDNEIEVLASDGLEKLGGANFDKKLQDLVIKKFKDEKNKNILDSIDGILVPGGFGERGTEGKIFAIKYAREKQIPFFGICLGLQLSIIEFARNIVGLKDATSAEFPESGPKLIDYMEGQKKDGAKGGSMRLGAYDCSIEAGTLAAEIYQEPEISERHRHRLEVNNEYVDQLKKSGMIFSGMNKKLNLVEVIELDNHPFFISCQYHPEFKSRPFSPHPLFAKFIEAANKKGQE